MCLAIPAQIIELLDQQRALVNVGGIERDISLALLNDAKLGDYVIIHVGYALCLLDQQEAEKTLELFAQLEHY